MSFYEYSADYIPPMPRCFVLVGPPGGEPTVGPLEALIDTGADFPIFPLDLLQRIGAQRVNRGRARSVWGDSRTVDVFALSLHIEGLRFQAIRVLADAQSDELIVGRHLLNRLRLVLDGPAGMVEVSA